jgi:hypothetical protein
MQMNEANRSTSEQQEFEFQTASANSNIFSYQPLKTQREKLALQELEDEHMHSEARENWQEDLSESTPKNFNAERVSSSSGRI